jgi:hypothetical protein
MKRTISNRIRKRAILNTGRINKFINETNTSEPVKLISQIIVNSEFSKVIAFSNVLDHLRIVGDLNPTVAGFMYSLVTVILLPLTFAPFRFIRDAITQFDIWCMIAVEQYYDLELLQPYVREYEKDMKDILTEIAHEEMAKTNKENFKTI